MSLAGIPVMPVRDAPETALWVYTGLMALVTVAFFVAWARSPDERRVGIALPVLLVGGMLSGLMESWLDNVVLVGYPPEQNLPVLESFGRSVPIFVPIGYGWFCGGLLYVVARAYQRGVTPGKVWRLFGLIALVDFVAIGLSSWIGILEFYGDPPMEVLGYPIWWAGIDGLDVVLGGAIVLVLLRHLKGRAQAWLVFVPSIALGAATGIVGWPITTALNSSWSMPAKYACACASLTLSLVCVRFLSLALPRLLELLGYEATGASRAPNRSASKVAAATTTAQKASVAAPARY